ncbi:hypothetical protein [Variovorax sp. ZT4R33]|uniref:hypothetical protein n=1 Tax=Variovorax sp. ZT4R33 TaxID=3443743 RepID=UPI003F48350D
MARRLLSLAVTVDQLDSGDYAWRILDSPDHFAEFEPLVEGSLIYVTYIDALRAGCDALVALCDDPLIGPVEELDDASSDEEF